MFRKLVIAGVGVFVLLQLLRPGIPFKPAAAELQATPEIKHIVEQNCYSCHSDQRRLSWFDEIVPAYWLVRHDILTAREHLNFSTLGSKPAAMQKATLYEAVNMIQLGAMPLPSFVKVHPEAKVTPEELRILKAYLAPWTPAPIPISNPAGSSGGKTDAALVPPIVPAPANLAAVHPELNGFVFDPTFENWKPLSTTDRGDNNTFRFILGNDIAVKAAQAGNISPWPDGARFAKIAWQQEPARDGLLHPGKFVQVELMLKNARLYKDNQGWGWGRWRGLDLQPYGKDAQFVNECTGCHQPMRRNDYVYTLPVSAAKFGRDDVLNNAAARLPVSLPYQPLGWSAITMYVDPKTHITATLFGNEVAIKTVQPRRAAPASAVAAEGPPYAAGAVLALVTWAQRDDPHWFGARIPDTPRSVEFVRIAAGPQPGGYQRFSGLGLAEDPADFKTAAQRTSFVLGLAPAQLP